MTTQEVAEKTMEYVKAMRFAEALDELYADEVVSVEAQGQHTSKGLAEVKAKNVAWSKDHDVHSAEAEGPLVADQHFSVVYKIDVTNKPSGKRFVMEEIATYRVQNGKIVFEEFFYAMPGA